jgi:hypothetical protein
LFNYIILIDNNEGTTHFLLSFPSSLYLRYVSPFQLLERVRNGLGFALQLQNEKEFVGAPGDGST